jgi:hypothetical protein
MVNVEHVEMFDAIQNPHLGLLVVTGCILLLALSVLTLRYASHKYPSVKRPAAAGASAGAGAGGTEEMG